MRTFFNVWAWPLESSSATKARTSSKKNAVLSIVSRIGISHARLVELDPVTWRQNLAHVPSFVQNAQAVQTVSELQNVSIVSRSLNDLNDWNDWNVWNGLNGILFTGTVRFFPCRAGGPSGLRGCQNSPMPAGRGARARSPRRRRGTPRESSCRLRPTSPLEGSSWYRLPRPEPRRELPEGFGRRRQCRGRAAVRRACRRRPCATPRHAADW